MLKRILSMVLVSGLFVGLVACGAKTPDETKQSSQGSSGSVESGDTEEYDAFMKFPEVVEVHIGMSVSPTDKTLPDGDSAGDNQYTRYLLENFNIKVVVDWTAAEGNDYNQKVSLAIGGNNLPDALIANDRTYMTKAAESGLLYDLTDLFPKMASPQVAEIVEMTDGMAVANASYDGKMVSLPNITTDADGVHNLLIRKDWLDEVGLDVPKTVADIENAARVFVEKKMGGDNTIGIMGPSKNTKPYATFLASSNNSYGFDPIFSAMDVYPGYWLEQDDGSVIYGTTEAGMKEALALLAGWYAEGLLDPEVGTRDDSGEPLFAGQSGIYFGPWWALGYGNADAFKNNPEANWQSYPVYTDDGDWNVHMKTVGTTYTLINKNVSEDVAKAILVMNNALVRDEATFDTSVAIGWYPLRNVMAAPNESEYEHAELMKILRGEADPEDYAGASLYKLMYSDAKIVKDVVLTDGTEDLNVSDFSQESFGDFQRMYSLLIGDRPFATETIDKKVYSATYNQTETMSQKWSNLQKLEEETVLKIIVGQSPVDEFDNFVSQWKAQGGDEITAEVADTLKN